MHQFVGMFPLLLNWKCEQKMNPLRLDEVVFLLFQKKNMS